MFGEIFLNIITPIFILIGVGTVLNRVFTLEMRTLSRLMFYVFTPTVIFTVLLNSDLTGGDILAILFFGICQQLVMLGLSWLSFKFQPFREYRRILMLSSATFNGANYGFPLMLLTFGEYAIGVMAPLIVSQVLVTFTLGVMLLDSKNDTLLKSFTQVFRLPILYAIILGLIARAVGLELPTPLAVPLGRIADGYAALALITLGAQLARTDFLEKPWVVLGGVSMRLLIVPLATMAFIPLFAFSPEIEPVLILAAGLPIAVNIYILALEFEADAQFASLLIFWSTLLTMVTIPIWIMINRSG